MIKRFICWILSKLFPYESEYSVIRTSMEETNREKNWYDLKNHEGR